MKILFMGTPTFAETILKALLQSHHQVVGVVTQPDKPVGRKKTLMPSPVKTLALSHGIDVYQPIKMKDDYEALLHLDIDLIVTAAYGQMIPKAILDQFDAINVHGSLLPKYRGGAPIQHALFNGDTTTGITIMYMAFKMDSGDIIKQEALTIEKDDNYGTLSSKLSQLGAHLLMDVLKDYEDGIRTRIPQDESQVTYAFTLKRSDEKLDFNNPSDVIIQRLRGLLPEPGGYFEINNQMVKVFEIQKNDIMKHASPGVVLSTSKQLTISTKDGSIDIIRLLVPGKKHMHIKDFLNGQNIIHVGDVVQ